MSSLVASDATSPSPNSLKIAVATNFVMTLETVAHSFQSTTNTKVDIVSGSSGKLFAQIINGLAVDLFLSADQARVDRLAETSFAVPATRVTYAEGRLAWWQPLGDFSQDGNDALPKSITAKIVALAQPSLAPYGMAAKQTLNHCMNLDQSQTVLVFGENVGQAFAYVRTGNANAGLVALAQVRNSSEVDSKEFVTVPLSCHDAIKQDAIVVSTGTNPETAKSFLAFMHSTASRELIEAAGYSVP